MRSEPNIRLEQLRLDGPRNSNCGVFGDGPLRIIVSDGKGWDHVSVSRAGRCPSWAEMDRIKCLCFRDDEVVMQLHINDARKVNIHHYCLHLWRPQTAEEIAATEARWEAAGEVWPYGGLVSAGTIPLPPKDCV